jgi:DnaJ family protein C protein 13
MQELALAEGALPRHLHVAMFTQSNDARMLAIRQLSRHLVGLWVTGHPTAMALLKRIMVSHNIIRETSMCIITLSVLFKC